MEEKIGTTAGHIYKYLVGNGEISIAALKKEIELDDPTLLPMGIGWLAREGKVTCSKKGKNILVALIPEA